MIIQLTQGQDTITGKLILRLYPYLTVLDKVLNEPVYGGHQFDGGEHSLWFRRDRLNIYDDIKPMLELFNENTTDINEELKELFINWILHKLEGLNLISKNILNQIENDFTNLDLI